MSLDPGPFKFRVRLSAIFRRMSSPCLYFIQEGTTGPVKIGKSTCSVLEIRLSQLQTGNPRRIRFVGVVPVEDLWAEDTLREEQRLHKHFAEWKVSGEWFEVCPSLQALIDEFAYEKYGVQLRRFLQQALAEAQHTKRARLSRRRQGA